MASGTRKSNVDSGFGTGAIGSGSRYYLKDGRVNVSLRGLPYFQQLSWYRAMVNLPRWKFWCVLFGIYIVVNLCFATVYYFMGRDDLAGVVFTTEVDHFLEAFFFSVQTYTTVGYGRIAPVSMLASSVAGLEAFVGVLSFALASGLFYGRFSRPKSHLLFSENALIAPFREGKALMMRVVPYGSHHLTDGEAAISVAMRTSDDPDAPMQFFQLTLDIQRVNALVLNWTLVHLINEESPLWGIDADELIRRRAELLVFVKAYDEVYAATVVARSSYTAEEVVYGAKFEPMYQTGGNRGPLVVDVKKLNSYKKV